MSIGENLTKEVQSWGTLAIVIVIFSLILLNFLTSNPGNSICEGGWNVTATNCLNASGGGQTVAHGTTGGFITTILTGLSEPQNWVIIVVISVVGFAILALFLKKRKGN